MTMHSKDWGILTKWLYQMVRPKLIAIANDSSNTADDTLIRVIDKLVQ